MEFSIWRPPYWIRHLEISKSEIRFAISDLENPRIPSFVEIGDFFKEEMNYKKPVCFGRFIKNNYINIWSQ